MRFLFWILVSFSAGIVGSRFQPGAWYAQLKKPSWNPPNWIFAPVWTLLYIAMGVAAALVWSAEPEKRTLPLAVFMIQLTLNALWSWIFFGLKKIGLAVIEIGFLWVSIVLTLILFNQINSWAGKILIPYLLWVSFATILNTQLWRLNSRARSTSNS